MPRGLNNWSYRQVVKFLNSFGFRETHSRGSHHYFLGHHDGIPWVVSVSKHSIMKTGTMEGIVAQSGIPKKEWRK